MFKDLIDLRQKALADLQEIVNTAKSEKRDLEHDEREKSTRLVTEVKGIDEKIAEAKKAEEETSSLVEFLNDAEAKGLNESALEGAKRGPGPRKSIGQSLIKTDQYRRLMDQHGGIITESTKGVRMDPVQVGGLKSLLTGSNREDSAGTLVQPDDLGIVPYPVRQLALRELITVGQTGSDRIEYAQVLPDGEGKTKNAAAGIPEADKTTGDRGKKPESGLSFRKASADVITIAHWLPTTKRALSDAAQLQTLIDGFLRDGIARETERLIVSGDEDNAPSNTEEWDGILNTSGVQNQEYVGSIASTARKMITKVSAIGADTTGFIVSPEVDEALDLLQDSNGRYYGQGPFGNGPDTLWGRPRVAVHGVPENTIIGGDLQTCVLWDREQATITATDSHDDFFIRNLVAVLGEGRAAFGILDPASIAVAEVDIDGDVGGSDD